jgi:hypothetical protein
MKQKFYLVWPAVLVFSLSILFAVGCSDNPVSPGDEDEVNKTVEKVSSNSVEIYNTVSSVKQISDLLQGPESKVDVGIPEVKNPGQAMNFYKSMMRKSFDRVQSDPKLLTKIQGALSDSVIWDVTVRREVLGFTVRNSLIYNSKTDSARLFEVRFDFDDRHRLAYDSTEIKAKLNFTLFNPFDDVLLSLENLKQYKPGRLLQEEKVSFVPDPYAPGTEPEGGILESNITYSSSSSISRTHARLEYHKGSGGSWSKEVLFSDGTKHTEAITFSEDGTGTFSETRRDGTRIEGTFDSAEEDGQGGFTKTITFPEGHDPVSIFESGSFTQNLADSTLSGSFQREVRFKDGTVRKESVTVDEKIENGIKTTTITVQNPDGSGGTITVEERPEVDKISGEWSNTDGTFLIFSAEAYPDGSAHLKFDLYASKQAYENGEDPIASGEFDFFPDGSGQGQVTEGGQTYDVTINSDGSITIKVRA